MHLFAWSVVLTYTALLSLVFHTYQLTKRQSRLTTTLLVSVKAPTAGKQPFLSLPITTTTQLICPSNCTQTLPQYLPPLYSIVDSALLQNSCLSDEKTAMLPSFLNLPALRTLVISDQQHHTLIPALYGLILTQVTPHTKKWHYDESILHPSMLDHFFRLYKKNTGKYTKPLAIVDLRALGLVLLSPTSLVRLHPSLVAWLIDLRR